MRHRVAMVLGAPFPALRGTQAWVAELSRALLGQGHEVHLFSYAAGGEGEVPEGLVLHRARRLPFVRADVGSAPSVWRPLNDAALLAELLGELEALEPTIIHGHNHEGGLAASLAGRALGLPVVHQVHSALAEELVAWAPRARPVLAPVGALIDHGVPRLAAEVMTLDGASALRLERPGRTPVVLPPGVSRLAVDRTVRPPSGPVVAYAGNLDPYQDLPHLTAAFAEVRRRVPAARLHVITHDAGGPTLPGALVTRCESRDVAAAHLAAATVSVVPRGGGGGFPVKLTNALGLGVPVVATHAAAKGLEIGDGVLAVDPEGISDALVRVLVFPELRDRLAAGARAFAHAHPWSGVADAALAVYDRLARPYWM